MRSSWFLGALLLALPAQAAEFFVPKPGEHHLMATIEMVQGFESTEVTFYIAGQNPVDASCERSSDCQTLFWESRMVPRDHGDPLPPSVRFNRRTTHSAP